jgi:hypothetical protein
MTNTATAAPKKAETKVETITMTDGRIVDFVGKRKLLKESFVNDGVVSIRLDFRNGETRTFAIPSGLLLKFAAHGAEQKLGDEIAGLDDIEDAVMAIDELTDRLNKGEWGVKREGNGMAGTSILARALVEVMGKDMSAIKTFLGTKTQAEKVALRNNPRVKPVVERLEAEKASKSKGAAIDTDSLLASLETTAEVATDSAAIAEVPAATVAEGKKSKAKAETSAA